MPIVNLGLCLCWYLYCTAVLFVISPAISSILLLLNNIFLHGHLHKLCMLVVLLKRPSKALTTTTTRTTTITTTAALSLSLILSSKSGIRPFVTSFRLATTRTSKNPFLPLPLPPSSSLSLSSSFPSRKIMEMAKRSEDLPNTNNNSSNNNNNSNSSNNKNEYDGDYSSLSSLEMLAKDIIATNLQRDVSSRTRVCIVIAGGGGHSISTLTATSGASSLLLEGTIAYDRNSFLRYVEKADTKGFQFSNVDAARIASVAALKRAMNYCSMDDNVRLMPRCVGVGCASAMVASSAGNNNSNKHVGIPPTGRGHVVATRADGLQLTLSISLDGKQKPMGTERRTRLEEDMCMSHLILKALERLDGVADSPFHQSLMSGTTRDVITSFGDSITESWGTSVVAEYISPSSSSQEETESTTADKDEIRNVVEMAARRVVDGNEGAVVLLPVYSSQQRRPVSFRCLTVPVLPNRSLIFPGSFNPPHRGHVALANAAIRTLERQEPYIHRVHNEKPVFFELSLLNADKPAIDPTVVADRVNQFLQLEDLPQQWGVVLTGAPLFGQKLLNLQDCVTNRSDGTVPQVNFVIGTDTLVRIINPKYYNNDEGMMVQSLLAMTGAHFIVGGRLEQQQTTTTTGSTVPPRFVSGQEELEGLPADLIGMFTIMLESEFRVDVSSSEIRAAAASSSSSSSVNQESATTTSPLA